MNSLHCLANLPPLGNMELLVIFVLLAIVAAPIGLTVFFVVKAAKRRKAVRTLPPQPPVN